ENGQMIAREGRSQEVGVLIEGRGGGYVKDVWCFNEDMVVRAIFHSRLPIISAVGHETGVTIADFVADLHAPTPSAAAELVSRNQQALLQQLVYQRQRLEMALVRLFKQKDDRLQRLHLRLHNQHPQRQLSAQKQLMQQLA
ncbi:exodeoxyribonuclease VII large subunit, partial [Pasteurella multocida]|uniref:exodeoxyribonuclease VII large subunit n=1 Tax=Pasteurella multocida TaxID=747 RepID=UPI0017EE72DC|nr:exodeoxyribonuclease VII large subunit [Pasteurella multocida]